MTKEKLMIQNSWINLEKRILKIKNGNNSFEYPLSGVIPNLRTVFRRNDNTLDLNFQDVKVELEEYYGEKLPVFYLEQEHTFLSYNIKTHEIIGDFSNSEELKKILGDESTKWILSVLYFQNKWLYAQCFKAHCSLFLNNVNTFKNICSMIQDGTIQNIEKLSKCFDFDFVANHLSQSDFNLKNGNKLKQVVNMPVSVIEFTKQHQETYNLFHDICDIDPNEAILVIKYYKIWHLCFRGIKRSLFSYFNFINIIMECKKKDNEIKMKDIIPYLVKQDMYFNNTLSHTLFTVPISMARTYRDALNLGMKERYPSNLKMEHNLLVRNNKCLLNGRSAELFKKAVDSYRYLEYADEKFLVLVPNNIKELVEEGSYMHHCVATYVPLISNKITRVVFVRKKEYPNESFVTVEIDKHLNIVQAKGKFDQDVTDTNVLKFIQKWTKEKKKEGYC